MQSVKIARTVERIGVIARLEDGNTHVKLCKRKMLHVKQKDVA